MLKLVKLTINKFFVICKGEKPRFLVKAREKRTRTTNQLKSEHALWPKGNQIEYGGEQFCNWTCFPSHIKAPFSSKNTQKILHSTHQIKSLDACMEH
jgi:hypothetical protein